MGAQKNRLIETVPLSTHSICFGGEIRKLFFWYALLTKVLHSVGSLLFNIENNDQSEAFNVCKDPDEPAHRTRCLRPQYFIPCTRKYDGNLTVPFHYKGQGHIKPNDYTQIFILKENIYAIALSSADYVYCVVRIQYFVCIPLLDIA